ncbi:MAG: hypothetical protein QOJ51_6963, partial [Acidobacteriaceae bacterium]|nr:hypothetical protein [Acidobacteriaceae bacterium]
MDNLQKSIYGSVRPYTRHQAGCRYINSPDHNSCNCPKWLYVWNAETGDRSRKSLATPSWAEAQRIGAETLRGMDPEIAAARAVKNDRKDAVTVADACDLWIERTRNKFGEHASVLSKYQWLKKKVAGWANAHGIVNVRDITTLQLERWYGSNEWNFAATTKQQRWGILRSMFSFLEKRGV